MESLQSSIENIPSAERLQDALDDLKTQLQEIADNPSGTSSETLNEIQTDLEELLESNNIYSEDLVINSETLLEFAEKLNDRVAIINGDVEIVATPDLDHDRSTHAPQPTP